MIFNRVGFSRDFESDCGKYRASASNDNFNDAYYPMIITQASPFRATSITKDVVSLDKAKRICENHSVMSTKT